jgi:hypothetical protein
MIGRLLFVGGEPFFVACSEEGEGRLPILILIIPFA